MPWKFLAAMVASTVLLLATIDLADARGGGGGGGGGGGVRVGGGAVRGVSGGRVVTGGKIGGGKVISGGKVIPGAKFVGPNRVYVGSLQTKHAGRNFRRTRVLAGYPVYYADGCEGLRRRAFASGNTYFWDRYYACSNGRTQYWSYTLQRTLADLGLRNRPERPPSPAETQTAARHLAHSAGLHVTDIKLGPTLHAAFAAPRALPTVRAQTFPSDRDALESFATKHD